MPLWTLLTCFVNIPFSVYCLPQSLQSNFMLLWILSSCFFKDPLLEKIALQNKHLFLLSLSMLGFVFDPMINDVKYNIYRTKMKLCHRVFWIKKGASRPYPGQHYGHNGIRAWGTLVVTLENEIGDGPLTFILILKSCGVGGWNPTWTCKVMVIWAWLKCSTLLSSIITFKHYLLDLFRCNSSSKFSSAEWWDMIEAS